MYESENPMNMTILRKPMTRVAILALCTTALSTIPMMAQDNTQPQTQGGGNGGGRMNPERQLEMMTKELNLTPDQVTQAKAINDDSRKQMMALRDDSSLDQDARRSKMMDIRKTSQTKIRGILTDEQKTKYDAMLTQMQARRGGGGAPQL